MMNKLSQAKSGPLAQCPCLEISLVIAILLTLPMVFKLPDTGIHRWWQALYAALAGWGRYIIPLFILAIGSWFDSLKRISDNLRPDRDDFILLLFIIVLSSVTLQQFALWRFRNLNVLELWRMGDGGGVIGAAILNLGYTLAGRAGALGISIFLWLTAVILFGGLLYKRTQRSS